MATGLLLKSPEAEAPPANETDNSRETEQKHLIAIDQGLADPAAA
jgi:hypothetical protein